MNANFKNDTSFQEFIQVSQNLLGLTNQECADELRVSVPTYQRWKEGKNLPHYRIRETIFKWFLGKAEVKPVKGLLDEMASIRWEYEFSIIENLFFAQADFYDLFQYPRDWLHLPIQDRRDYAWMLKKYEDGSGYVACAFKLTKETVINKSDIQKEEFLDNSIFRTKFFTIIAICDENYKNKVLAVFDNENEIEWSKFLEMSF